MKLIIAGSRTMNMTAGHIDMLVRYLKIDNITEIVSGCAAGIDQAAIQYHYLVYPHNPECTLKRFPANWDEHGKAAGPIRNKEMAKYADTLLLIWDGKSKGSANMKKEMTKLGKPIYEVIIKV